MGYSPWGHRVRHDWVTEHPCIQFNSIQSLSRVRLFATHEPQHSRPPCPLPTPGVYPNPCPLSQWCHPTISSSVVPFSSCPQSFPASGSFQISPLHLVVKVLEFQLQHQSFQRNPRADLQNGLVGSPCSLRDSQESSPTPQFKSINSLALSLLHSPTLTSRHNHRSCWISTPLKIIKGREQARVTLCSGKYWKDRSSNT